MPRACHPPLVVEWTTSLHSATKEAARKMYLSAGCVVIVIKLLPAVISLRGEWHMLRAETEYPGRRYCRSGKKGVLSCLSIFWFHLMALPARNAHCPSRHRSRARRMVRSYW